MKLNLDILIINLLWLAILIVVVSHDETIRSREVDHWKSIVGKCCISVCKEA